MPAAFLFNTGSAITSCSQDHASICGPNHVYISVSENFGLEPFVKLNRESGVGYARSTSEAKARPNKGALTAALKRCATQRYSPAAACGRFIIGVCVSLALVFLQLFLAAFA